MWYPARFMYADTPLLGRSSLLDKPTTAMERDFFSNSGMFDIIAGIELQRLTETLDLLRGEHTVASGRKVQFQKPNFDSPQFFHQPTEILEHHSDLVLAPFCDANFIPWIHA